MPFYDLLGKICFSSDTGFGKSNALSIPNSLNSIVPVSVKKLLSSQIDFGLYVVFLYFSKTPNVPSVFFLAIKLLFNVSSSILRFLQKSLRNPFKPSLHIVSQFKNHLLCKLRR